MPLHIKIITPERVVLEEDVDSLSLPTPDGEITVLPNHRPLVSLLATGAMTLRKGGEESHLASSGGFVEILPDSEVRILADSAERAEELALEKVEEARVRAEEALQGKRFADEGGHAALLGSLERELARLKVLRRSARVRRQQHEDMHTGGSVQE
ncbi:MAG: ATP synthase F1 subunit epsilon [bacterium]|nr:ATP synthase F1 subunit epsilon [bacterium]